MTLDSNLNCYWFNRIDDSSLKKIGFVLDKNLAAVQNSLVFNLTLVKVVTGNSRKNVWSNTNWNDNHIWADWLAVVIISQIYEQVEKVKKTQTVIPLEISLDNEMLVFWENWKGRHLVWSCGCWV